MNGVVAALFLGSAVNAATNLRKLAGEVGTDDWIPDVCAFDDV